MNRNACFVLLLFGSMLGGFAQTSVNTALPAIMGDLDISVMTAQWLATAYLLSFCIMTPLFAMLTRKFSLKALFVAAQGVFLLGSIVCSFAPNFAILLVGRIAEGGSAAIAVPLVQLFGLREYPVERRGFVMGFTGLAFGFAPNVGPAVAGFFTTSYGWRASFVFLIAYSLVCLIVGMFLLRSFGESHEGEGDAERVDMVSLVFSSVGFSCLLLGVSNLADYGFVHPFAIVPLLVGVVAVVVFLRRQNRIEHPLINLKVMENASYVAGMITLCLVNASFVGLNLVVALGLQEVRGCSAFDAGLLLLPGVVTSVIASPIAGWLQDRWGTRRVSIVASILVGVGTFALVPLASYESLVWVSFFQAVRCLGLAPLITTVNTWSMSVLDKSLTTDGMSLMGVVRQLCAAAGTTLLTLCIAYASALVGQSAQVSAFGITAAIVLAAVVWSAVIVLVVRAIKVEFN